MAVCLLSAICGTSIFAQTNTATDAPQTVDSDSEEEAFQKWAYIPIIASSTETGFMFGALAIRFLEPDSPTARTETIDMLAYGTVKGQYSATIAPNLYFSGGKYHLDARINGALWPGNYYGIGNDTPSEDPLEYESTYFSGECLLEREIGKGVYIGGSYTFQHEEIDWEDDGIDEENRITGNRGGNQSGPGISVSMDTRDNINDAKSGTYIIIESKWLLETLGSDYDYSVYEFHAARYFTLPMNTGLALGCQARVARGDIPFRELSSPDGTDLLRGIENGRYRDRDMAAIQAEYRFPITGKWGGTVFAETAQVAHNLTDIELDDWKYSLGAGVRYALNPSERLNLRLDVGWVDDGIGFVLNFREAF